MTTIATLVRFTLLIMIIALASFQLNNSAIARADDDHGDYRTLATPIKIGTGQISGHIDPTNVLYDVDYFSFEALRGTRYTFVLDLVGVEDANILVVNSVDRGAASSPGQVVTSETGRKSVQWIARTTDTYFVEVSGTRDGIIGSALLGPYSFRGTEDTALLDRHSEDINGATVISIDNVYQGAISPWTNQPGLAGSNHGGDDQDYFSFQAYRGVKYTVDVQLGTAEGVDISIVRPNGGIEVSSGGTVTSLQWISPATGTYYIDVSGSIRFRDSIGTYSLKLKADTSHEDRHSQSHVGSTPLSLGNAHQGAVSPEDDRDVFSFQAVRGVRYQIQAALGTAQGIGLSVEGVGGDEVASNGGVGTGIEWVAPTNNLYYVVAYGSSQVREPVGTYSLVVDGDDSLRDRHGETVNFATSISFGNEHQGAVSPVNDRDYFSFEAQRGVIYTVNVALGTAEGVEIAVVRPDGLTEVSNGGVGTTVEWTAPSSGNYFVAIDAPPQLINPVGTYSIRVEPREGLEDRHGDSRQTATTLIVGSTYHASISPKGDSDYFTFQANRGVRYSFELTYGTAAAVSLSVDKLDGGPAVATNFGEGTDIVWIAPDDDVYFVLASGSPRVENATGTYSLQIQADMALVDRHSGTAMQSTHMILGNAMAGAVSPPDDVDFFFFDAQQGVEYAVIVELGTAKAVRLSLTNTLAGFAASNYDNGTSLIWQAPVTGTYLVAVSALEQLADPVGTYQITVATLDSLPEPEADPAPAPAPKSAPSLPTGPALIAESRTAAPGRTVLVPFSLQQANDLTSLGFTLHYDPTVLELVSVIRGARLAPASFSYDSDVPGTVRVGFAETTGISGGGSAAVVEFRIIGAEGAISPLSLGEVLAGNTTGGRPALSPVDGQLTVGQPVGGDGNGDGKITALDGLIALRMFKHLSPEDPVLDVDGDGIVTPEDARQILVMARP